MRMPRSTVRKSGIAAGCAALAMLVSACGSSTSSSGGGGGGGATPASNGIAAKSAGKAMTTSFKAFQTAKSVRVSGSFRDSSGRYEMDITIGPAGMRGSMTAPFEGSKIATADMVVTHHKFYLRSKTLWKQVGGASLASLIGDRWVVVPTSSLSGFPMANAKTFINTLESGGLRSLRSTAQAASKNTTVNGQPAVEFYQGGSAIYIATTGQPYPLELKQGGNALYFQYTGLPATFPVPPHPLNLSKMQG